MAADRERAAEQQRKAAEEDTLRRKQDAEGSSAHVGMKPVVKLPTSAATAVRKPGSYVPAGALVRRPIMKRGTRGF